MRISRRGFLAGAATFGIAGRAFAAADVDVAIVGAGAAGLAAAKELRKAGRSFVVLEARFAGYGASGRNGGWLTNSVTGGRAQYVRHGDRTPAVAQQRALTESVAEVVAVAEREGIDAGIAVGGDYRAGQESADAASVTGDGGRSWRRADTPPPAYRSGVTWLPHSGRSALAVGPTGTDVTRDGGRSWRTVDAGSYDTVDCAFAPVVNTDRTRFTASYVYVVLVFAPSVTDFRSDAFAGSYAYVVTRSPFVIVTRLRVAGAYP